MTSTEQKNEKDVLCTKCSTVIIHKNVAVSRKSDFSRKFLKETTKKSRNSPIGKEWQSTVEEEINITKLKNIKFIVTNKNNSKKPKEDKFNLSDCSIEDIEYFDEFQERVKDCWVAKDFFELGNIAFQKEGTKEDTLGKPVFCGSCFGKTKPNELVDIIGWAENYANLKPVYIIKERVKMRNK